MPGGAGGGLVWAGDLRLSASSSGPHLPLTGIISDAGLAIAWLLNRIFVGATLLSSGSTACTPSNQMNVQWHGHIPCSLHMVMAGCRFKQLAHKCGAAAGYQATGINRVGMPRSPLNGCWCGQLWQAGAPPALWAWLVGCVPKKGVCALEQCNGRETVCCVA